MLLKRQPKTGSSACDALGWRLFLWLGTLLFVNYAARGANLDAARQTFQTGHYKSAIAEAQQALTNSPTDLDWQTLLTKSLLAVGQYPEAYETITNALAKHPRDLPLHWLAHNVFLLNGQTDAASNEVKQIVRLISTRPWAYREPADLVAFGRAALVAGADPRRVMDRLYATAKKADPKLRDSYLAGGELALEKHDYALAAKLFQSGLKEIPNDPDLEFGLARAYAPSDRTLMQKALETALAHNSNHVGSLLLLADYDIDAEDYVGADKLLARVLSINPWEPDAWAYRAVLAVLRNQPAAEIAARQMALKYWPTNPHVDYLIGLKLSQKYRFSVGATHQFRALHFDPGYLPAKIQLAQDLLRLGEESQGWRLADEVQRADGYNILANNLMKLHDVLAKYQTLTNAHFILRMQTNEAALYGQRALALLEKARTRLCAKYGLTLDEPTLVEIFHEQKDFAVRTFGMPGNDGYLGVCFGSVITANSPASRPGQPFNWETMLWHEFTHVVTLHLTHNKMPRWLSEGISVYEERQADPSWGEHLNPQYREMLLSDDLTPVSKLSGAFLAPKSATALQFAYYESSLVVEFLVQRFGQKKLIAILHALGEGTNINEALAQYTEPMTQLESDFKAFAHKTAAALAPRLDWIKPPLKKLFASGNSAAWDAWARMHPNNFWVMTRQAQQFMDDKQWTEAQRVLQRLVQFYPDFTGPQSAYRQLAAADRALGETNAEQQVLTRFAAKDDTATDAYLRLAEMGAAAHDWPTVIRNARRYLAVNPLVAAPYRYLAQASAAIGQTQTAIAANQALLALGAVNPVEVHFQLAQLLYQAGEPSAKRQLLEALEDAPRYKAALRLLLKMDGETSPSATPPAVTLGAK